ncbi:MAG: long-chain fatty acid--CoA ligase, partial [Halobacteria archaeon]|nr:long-chain fatty acid--CoA ligase [Halobacteria archaeon]
VPPEPIEDSFSAVEVVEQCLVIGDGRKFVSAVMVPNIDHIRDWADEEGVSIPDDPEGICHDEDVRGYIDDEVDEVNREFEEYERIKKFVLVPEEWTEENGLLTPTLKKKRHKIVDAYEEEIESMYPD